MPGLTWQRPEKDNDAEMLAGLLTKVQPELKVGSPDDPPALTHVAQQSRGALWPTIQRKEENEAPLAAIQGHAMFNLLPLLQTLPNDVRSDTEAASFVGGPRLVTAIHAVNSKGKPWRDYEDAYGGELAALPSDQRDDIMNFMGATLLERLKTVPKCQEAINNAVRALGIDTGLLEGGVMHYVSVMPEGEGKTYPPGNKELKQRRPGIPPNRKPYVEIYNGAFGDGLPLLSTTVWHEYQHVLQMLHKPGILVPGLDSSGYGQDAEAYCREIIQAEREGSHLQGNIKVQIKPGEEKVYSGPDYIEKVLWRRLSDKWAGCSPAIKTRLSKLYTEAKAAAERMVGHPL